MELGYNSNIENKVNLSHKKLQFYERMQHSIPELLQSNISSLEETIRYIEENEAILKKIAKQNQVEAFKRHLNDLLRKQKSSIPPNYQHPDATLSDNEDDTDNSIFFSKLDDTERKAAEYLVKLCESDYLKESNEELKDLLWKYADINISLNQIDEIIEKINFNYKPFGTCTRDLKEYWLIYLRYLRNNHLQERNELIKYRIEIAQNIILNYYDEFCDISKWYKIINNLNLNKKSFLEIRNLINKIPRKNIQGLKDPPNKIRDYSVKRENDKIIVKYIGNSFHDNEISDISLEMNKDYFYSLDMQDITQFELKEKEGKLSLESKKYLNSLRRKIKKINDTQNDISLHQEIRINILKRIVEFQEELFLSGDESTLKPMKLEDIAKLTGYHISTISRFITINKIETEHGDCLLKNLFSGSASNVDSRSLKYILIVIQEAIHSEDKNKPISDAEIRKFLFDEYSININLRTIANHREKKLNIPNANIRKVIYDFNLQNEHINKRETAIFQ